MANKHVLMELMKILIISDAWEPQVNGVVRTYQALRDELTRQGHEVRVIGPDDFKPALPMLGYGEIKLAVLPDFKLIKMIRDFRPDSIHIATEGPLGWAARRYCKLKKYPFTTCYHTKFPDYVAERVAKLAPQLERPSFLISKEVIRTFHNASSCVLVTTPTVEKQLREFGVKAPIAQFTRGVDERYFYRGEKTLFQDLPKPIALFVGRLAIEKNIEEFLKMEWSGSKIVVGSGPDEKTLKKKYKDIHFVGKQMGKTLGDHYRSADLFVFPSRTDTFGMVLIEALACGTPIAAFPVMGPIDVVTAKHIGCLNENLSTAAKTVLKASDKQKCAQHIKENYSWCLAAEQFLTAQTQSLIKRPDKEPLFRKKHLK